MISLYDIEHYMPPPVDKWHSMPSFKSMRKSFAEGAWAMLKAYYDHDTIHRLVKDGEVIDQLSEQKTCINEHRSETYVHLEQLVELVEARASNYTSLKYGDSVCEALKQIKQEIESGE